ncbi:MAG: hypothetical protein ABI679_05345 [Gemmatimonadota bacterium]
MRNTTMTGLGRLFGAATLVLFLGARPLAGQVGHPPAKSPYHDILHGSSWSFIYGNLSGDGGKLGIGPHNGPTYGMRYDFRMSNLIQAGLSASYMDLERLIVDADDTPATRVKGPVAQSVVTIEVALQLNLTGAKTWHRLQPFITGGLGYALSSTTKADTSGFKFGNRFSISPGLGMRFFPSSRVNLRVEARQHFWKLKYPTAFQDEPADVVGGIDNSDAVITDKKLNEWASGWWIMGGIGFSF